SMRNVRASGLRIWDSISAMGREAVVVMKPMICLAETACHSGISSLGQIGLLAQCGPAFLSHAGLCVVLQGSLKGGGFLHMSTQTASELTKQWQSDARWTGILRPYSGEDVARLRGSIHVEHTLARLGAERLWTLLHTEPYVAALGALTGNQAVQQVKAGLKAIYL